MASIQNFLKESFRGKPSAEISVAIGVVLVVLMMIIPLSAPFLDAFMTINLMLSFLVILTVLYNKDPLEFSVFPTVLLISTVFSLALNISSTRMILSKGALFNGRIIRAFASFVVGTTGTQGLIIGFIIFSIIVAVQYMVITKGSTRISEVAARFELDGMPGKQMTIDSEYSSGAITEEEARRRKKQLQNRVDFFGAMDGATKFVSGNVKVGIVITLINIIGGLIIGVSVHGEPFQNALRTYTTLTVGDGLVSQLPMLIISVATGLVVTRSISEKSFGEDVSRQFSRQGKVYWIAAVVLLLLGILPGFPWYLLLPMAALVGYTALRLGRRKTLAEAKIHEGQRKKAEEKEEEFSPIVPLDPLSLELGYGLVPLVDRDQGAELLDRIKMVRRESALDLGLVIPRIRIIDNIRLDPSEYCLKIKGMEVGRGSVRAGQFMAINPGGERTTLDGEKTKDPAFGLSAQWVSEGEKGKAERAGYTVVDAPSVIATHLTEVIRRHCPEILGREEVHAILDALKKDYPTIIEEVIKMFSTGEIQKVLQGLLREQVSIRNLVIIFETLGDYGAITKSPDVLIEKVRQALGRQISLQHANDDRVLSVLTLPPVIEKMIIDAQVEVNGRIMAILEPGVQRRWINALATALKALQERGEKALLLCTEAGRPLVKSTIEREIPALAVLSFPEVTGDITVASLGEIPWDDDIVGEG